MNNELVEVDNLEKKWEVCGSKRNSDQINVDTFDHILSRSRGQSKEKRLNFIIDHLKLSKKEIDFVEKITIGQINNEEWYKYRIGRITASNFGKIFDTTLNRNIIFNELINPPYLNRLEPVQWGLDHEKDAKWAYSMKTGQEIKECGLFLDESGMLGASPDGVIDDEKIIEIKCPYNSKDLLIYDAIKDGILKYLKYDDNVYKLNMESFIGCYYYHQIQGQLYLSKRLICDLVIWSTKDLIIISIEKDELWDNNLNQLLNIYKNQFLPYYIDKDIDLENDLIENGLDFEWFNFELLNPYDVF